MIAQDSDVITGIPKQTTTFDRFVSHMSKKRLCLSMSFVLPFVAVSVIYLDECLFEGMNLGAVIVPSVVLPALLAGTSGTLLFLAIKYVRFLQKHC